MLPHVDMAVLNNLFQTLKKKPGLRFARFSDRVIVIVLSQLLCKSLVGWCNRERENLKMRQSYRIPCAKLFHLLKLQLGLTLIANKSVEFICFLMRAVFMVLPQQHNEIISMKVESPSYLLNLCTTILLSLASCVMCIYVSKLVINLCITYTKLPAAQYR